MRQTTDTLWMRPVAALAVASLVLLAGSCSSDDGDGNPQPPSVPTFDTFIFEQFDQTADDTEPVAINELDFTFGNEGFDLDELCE
jgi:hypothetical protein